jgi:hypothetical protein
MEAVNVAAPQQVRATHDAKAFLFERHVEQANAWKE